MQGTRILAAWALAASLALSASAGETSPAQRMPKGATVYLEARDLAGLVHALIDSPLGEQVRNHPGIEALLSSPQAMKLQFGLALLKGATGADLLANLDAVAGGEIAVAVYGSPKRALLVARVEPEGVQGILAGLETLAQVPRETVEPASGDLPALWRLGTVYFALDRDELILSGDESLARAAHAGVAEPLSSEPAFVAARATAPRDATLFACVDLAPFAGKLAAQGLPKDFGQALLGGALTHRLRGAPWAALSLRLVPAGDGWALDLRATAPRPEEEPAPVTEAFAGTLGPLPFVLPERTVALLRLRRSVPALWSNRDQLVAEGAIPGMIRFETNFASLTSGMGFLDEFLPHVGDEVIVVGTRPVEAEDEPQPALRVPDGALVWPLRDAQEIARALRVTFYNTVGVVNAQGRGLALLPESETYRGVRIDTARYGDPHVSEMGAMGGGSTGAGAGLPLRYNFAPSMAIVDDHLVVATSDRIVRQLVDAFAEGPAPAPPSVNAGLWLEPAEARRMLDRDREALVAKTMLDDGLPRADAEQRIDLALAVASLLREVALTAEETEHEQALHLRVVVGTPR